MINIKQADNLETIVIGMLTFNSITLVVLFDSGATHSFISSEAISQIGVESHKYVVDLDVNLTTKKGVKYSVMYKNYMVTLNQEDFEGDLIQLDPSEFDIILEMN